MRSRALVLVVALAMLPVASARAGAPTLRMGIGMRNPAMLDVAGDLSGDVPLTVRVPLRWSAGPAELAERAQVISRVSSRPGWRVVVSLRFDPPEGVGLPGRAAAFAGWVRGIVGRLAAPNVAFDVTNRVNAPVPDPESDAGHADGLAALISGVVAAHAAASGTGAGVGFSWLATGARPTDTAWWTELAARAPADFGAAVDFVDVQLYPGTFVAGTPWSAGGPAAFARDALRETRSVLVPLVPGLDLAVPLMVGEFGYAALSQDLLPVDGGDPDIDALRHTEALQAKTLLAIVQELNADASTFGVTDAVWWTLSDDTRSCALGLCFGLVDGDGVPRTAYYELRSQIKLLS